MNLITAVIDDLFKFATSSIFGMSHGLQSKKEPHQNTIEVIATQRPIEIEEEHIAPTFRSTADILIESDRPLKNTVMYVGGTGTPLYRNPTIEFDSIVDRLSYGAMVMVIEVRGRWSKIIHNGSTGWILREDLIDRAAHVYPHFIIGEPNESDDPNTIRVRAMLEDIFAGGESGLPLLSSEYASYRLLRKGLKILWPKTRPRTEGAWHTILKGVPGIYMSIAPKTGSVMEYSTEEG